MVFKIIEIPKSWIWKNQPLQNLILHHFELLFCFSFKMRADERVLVYWEVRALLFYTGNGQQMHLLWLAAPALGRESILVVRAHMIYMTTSVMLSQGGLLVLSAAARAVVNNSQTQTLWFYIVLHKSDSISLFVHTLWRTTAGTNNVIVQETSPPRWRQQLP